MCSKFKQPSSLPEIWVICINAWLKWFCLQCPNIPVSMPSPTISMPDHSCLSVWQQMLSEELAGQPGAWW